MTTTADDTKARLSGNSLRLVTERYVQECDEGPKDMFMRVARGVAEPERPQDRGLWAEKFYNLIYPVEAESLPGLYSSKFLPNTPTLVHAGVPNRRSDGKGKCLSACHVDSPEDDLESITRIGHAIPHIESSGGGMGWGLSKLRPKGDKLDGGTGACGPVAVLKWYAQAGRTFTQGATRPGAHMAQLHISHPDILEFIRVKDDCLSPDDPIANVNLSVQVPDDFMECLDKDDLWPLINPRDNKVWEFVKATDLWNEICESAWKTGDPGVAFIDRVHETQPEPSKKFGPIQTSNPCWSGDTKIWTTNGIRSFKDLAEAGEDVEVWTLDGEGFATTRMMRKPRMTRDAAETVVVTVISSYDEIQDMVLTPDHNLFIWEDTGEGSTRTRRQAKDLNVGDSLVSFYVPGDVEEENADLAVPALNHAVLSIRPGERIPVYNGTVDEFHTYLVDMSDGDGFEAVLSANCGEEWLESPGGSCNLGSINLVHYFDPGAPYPSDPVDYKKLEKDVALAVRFLDNVIDINWFPFEYQKEMNLATRRIGLGVMGWADFLALAKIPYNSLDALALAKRISKKINEQAHQASIKLAGEKGGLPDCDDFPARNSSLTTIAPTGSISVIASCSSGIEPYFSLFWTRKALWSADGKNHDAFMLEMPMPLRSMLTKEMPGFDFDDQSVIEQLAGMGEHEQREWVSNILGDDVVRCFPTSHSLDPDEHVLMHAAWQTNVDNGVSKTINLRNEATPGTVSVAFREAYDTQVIKATTVYRDGSKLEQVLQSGKRAGDLEQKPAVWKGTKIIGGEVIDIFEGDAWDYEEEAEGFGDDFVDANVMRPAMPSRVAPEEQIKASTQGHPSTRPKSLGGRTHFVQTGHGPWYVTLNEDPVTGKPIEVFITPRNNDPCTIAASSAVAKLVSLSLRSGVDVEVLADGIKGLECGHPIWSDGKLIKSAWDALAQLLAEVADINVEEAVDVGDRSKVVAFDEENKLNSLLLCQTCGGKLAHVGGCQICQTCGISGCE